MAGNSVTASSLSGMAVSADGAYVDVHTVNELAQPTTVRLSSRCLGELLLALPAAVQEAMRRRQADESLRLTYPLKAFTLEFGKLGEQQSFEFILSLHSIRGFAISFSGAPADLVCLANSVLEETAQLPRAPLSS
jgi:hypothetical protein